MAINVYSPCPGGTGKKIKFCCNDLLGELEKIDRMLEGEQYLAALRHIDGLGDPRRQRACLMATKALVLRATGQLDEAVTHCADFVQRFPDNPVAWAESAMIAAANEGGLAAMPKLLRAMELSDREMEGRVYEAMGAVAEALMEEREWLPARALLNLQVVISTEDPHPVELLIALNRSPSIPLMIRNDPPLTQGNRGAPWKARLDQAVYPLGYAHWQETGERLAALAGELPDVPAVWLDLALVRGWMADRAGASEAFQHYAALDVPLEDAVEARSLAMTLRDDPLGDWMDLLSISWTVRDVDRVQEALLSDARLVSVPLDPAAMGDQDTPPPRFTRRRADSSQAGIGRGVDARQDAPVSGPVDAFRTADRPRGAAGLVLRRRPRPGIGQDPCRRRWPARGSNRNRRWRLWPSRPEASGCFGRDGSRPRDITRQQADALMAEYLRDVVFGEMAAAPVGAARRQVAAGSRRRSGQSREGAGSNFLAGTTPGSRPERGFDFNQLRERLGLPTLGPIDPRGLNVDTLSLVRLDRLIVEHLTDEQLLMAFRLVLAFAVAKALRKLAQAIVDRPGFAEWPERMRAYSVLAQTAEDFDQALAHVNDGRQAAQAAGHSCLLGPAGIVGTHFGRGDGRGASRMIQQSSSGTWRSPALPRPLPIC